MSVTIRGTDNSVANPAFTGNDGDTGLYFPAANQLALATNGTQAVFVDSSQRVGVGIATPLTDVQINDTTAMGSGSATADIFSVTNQNAVVSGVAGDKLGIVISAMSDLSDRRVGLYCRAQNANFNNPDFSIFQTGQGIAFRETFRVSADSSANLQFNSGYGSVAVAYGCRAWINFNGVNNTILGSGNVSSITDGGTGVNTINFSVAMPNTNYAVTTDGISSVFDQVICYENLQTGNVTVKAQNGGGFFIDITSVSVAIHR